MLQRTPGTFLVSSKLRGPAPLNTALGVGTVVTLPEDIARYLHAHLPESLAAAACSRLATLAVSEPELLTPRIARCIAHIAALEPQHLERAISLARTDPRDLIVWVEYDNRFEDQLRDLSQPFSA